MSWIEWPTSGPKLPAVNSTEQALAGGGAELLGRVIYLNPPETGDAAGAEAAATAPAADDDGDQDVAVVQGWAGWPITAERFADAADQAVTYLGPQTDTDAAEQGWSRRVDAAVHGMDQHDPAGLDAWMQVHADSLVPQLHEARLVAAWETRQDHASEQIDRDADGWD